MKTHPGYKQVITKGQYMGEEGVKYEFGKKPDTLISSETRGVYDGYYEAVTFELPEHSKVMKNAWFGLLLYLDGLTNFGLTADEALAKGTIKIVEE